MAGKAEAARSCACSYAPVGGVAKRRREAPRPRGWARQSGEELTLLPGKELTRLHVCGRRQMALRPVDGNIAGLKLDGPRPRQQGMARAEPPGAWAALRGTRLALGRLASTGIDERATARSSIDSTRRIRASN